jgi:hypothetical protein
VHAARAALLAEIESSRTPRRRFRVPSRKTSLRVGLAAVTAAAAWTAAVVIAAPDAPSGPPPGSVTLVEFAMPTVPLALPSVPAGLTGPEYGSGSGTSVVTYFPAAAEGSPDLLLFAVSDDDDGCDGFDTDDVEVDGQDGEYGTRQYDGATHRSACLQWERRPGQWVQLDGDGRYADRDRLVAVAESLVDDEQLVPLQVHLAPAGWQLQMFKMSGRITTLANPAYPDESLTVNLPEEALTGADMPGMLEQVVGPVQEVAVNGLPAQLVRTGYGWYLQASFPDGTVFALQAPQAFTAEDVLAVAGGITYTPPAG